VKRCPTCNRTFADEHLTFCVEDGTPLVTSDPLDDEATVVRSSSEDRDSATGPSGFSGTSRERDSAAYQPPGSYVPRGSYSENKRRTWPWILGILAIVFIVFAGLGIAAAVFIPRLMRASNTNTNLNANVERRASSSPNSGNSNSNLNSNSNSAGWNANKPEEDTTPPPTDEAEVLSNLTDLEHEWTVANINADIKKLNRILADDYVGTSEGKAQGKAEYLKTIKRDTVIQKWAFEDLKVSLKGDRATLTGTLQLDVKDEQGQIRPVAYRFADKFVWRDARWQATSSEVNPLKVDQ
jgi:ketosteroid isomerase-like protein